MWPCETLQMDDMETKKWGLVGDKETREQVLSEELGGVLPGRAGAHVRLERNKVKLKIQISTKSVLVMLKMVDFILRVLVIR